MSLVKDIAEGVKETLNTATFSQPFTAERTYQPKFNLTEMKDLHVSVMPNGITTFGGTRGRNQHDCRIDVGVQKRVAEDQEIDDLLSLAEEIANHLRLRKLPTLPKAHWVKTEQAPLVALDHLDQFNQFTTVLTFTFRVIQ